MARELGLARIPDIRTTTARVTPMVWWAGGRVRILIPSFLLTELDREELRSILAHELAHVRRRDHLVRWIEWLACSVFWWNPVAWWASRQLRDAEESCCDGLALAASGSDPRSYANALLRVADLAATSRTLGAPVLASPAGGPGRTDMLERRLKMIIATDPTSPAPRHRRGAGWLAVLCMLPLGLLYCDRADAPAASEEELPDDSQTVENLDESQPSPVGPAFVGEANIRRYIDGKVVGGDLTEEEARELRAAVSVALEHGLVVELPSAVDQAQTARPVQEAEEDVRRAASAVKFILDSAAAMPAAAMHDPSTPEKYDTDISDAPTIVPMTKRPVVLNRAEILRALQREYPPDLKDAGIGGTVVMWFLVSEEGEVVKFQIKEPSQRTRSSTTRR